MDYTKIYFKNCEEIKYDMAIRNLWIENSSMSYLKKYYHIKLQHIDNQRVRGGVILLLHFKSKFFISLTKI